MAKVYISKQEVRRHLLPSVCMKCGETATVVKTHTFSWTPPWVIVTLFAGLLIWVIVHMCTVKRMRVEMPFCDEHENYLSRRRNGLVIGFAILAGLVILAVIVMAVNSGKGNDWGGYACCGVSLIGFGWLVAAALITQSGIRPSEITDDEIALINVSRDFEEAHEEVQYNRRRRRRAARRLENRQRLLDDDEEGVEDEDDGRVRRKRNDRRRGGDDDEDER